MLFFSRVVYKLLASKSESIRVQALKVLAYFLKHLGHKWVNLRLPRNLSFSLMGWFVFLRQGELCGHVRTASSFYENEFLLPVCSIPELTPGPFVYLMKKKVPTLSYSTYSSRKLYCTSLLIFKYVHKRHTLVAVICIPEHVYECMKIWNMAISLTQTIIET